MGNKKTIIKITKAVNVILKKKKKHKTKVDSAELYIVSILSEFEHAQRRIRDRRNKKKKCSSKIHKMLNYIVLR